MSGCLPPLPSGEGRGEGVLAARQSASGASRTRSYAGRESCGKTPSPQPSPGGRGGRGALLALALLFATPAHAVSDPAEMLPNPALETRAEQVGRQLRCLVCQNESIEDSNADLARDLRRLVRARIAGGDTDDAATAWVVARYGDFVRLSPPFNAATAVLWASPVIAVLAGLGLALMARRRAPAPAAPLTEAERRRLDALTGP